MVREDDIHPGPASQDHPPPYSSFYFKGKDEFALGIVNLPLEMAILYPLLIRKIRFVLYLLWKQQL